MAAYRLDSKRQRLMGLLATGLVLGFSNQALTDGNDPCTLEALTDSCKSFDPKGPDRVKLPDGTFIPNFSALYGQAEKNTALRSEKSDAEKLKAHEFSFSNQIEIMQILDQVDSKNLHPSVKLYLIQNRNRMKALFQKHVQEAHRPLELPWPLDDPKGQLKRVPYNEAIEKTQALFSEGQRKRISDLLEKFDEELPAQIEKTAIEKDMAKVSKERESKVKELIDSARNSIISEITKGRPESDLLDEELEAIEKIKSIKINGLGNPDLQKEAVCSGHIPNAFYRVREHSMNICPNFYNFPDSTIIAVIGHEMMHSLDACNGEFGTYSIDKGKLRQLMDENTARPSEIVRQDNERYQMFKQLLDISERSTYTAYPWDLILKPATIKFFEDQGVIKVHTHAAPPSRALFSDVYQCLQTAKGGGFRGMDGEELKHVADVVTQDRARRKGANYNAAADKKKIIDAFTAHKDCVGITRESQMGEVESDWMGSRVLGNFLKSLRIGSQGNSNDKKPLMTKEEKLAPFGFFAALVCLQRTKDREEESEANSGEVPPASPIEEALKDYSRILDSHPSSEARLNTIFLRDPQTRIALNCPDQTTGACTHDEDPQRLKQRADLLEKEKAERLKARSQKSGGVQ